MTTAIPYLSLERVNSLYAAEVGQAMQQVVGSGWYLRGQATARFEQHYADYIGTRHCVGVGNGLDALTLMLRACMELGRLHEGDEVIVPANTYIATILAITENGLKPVLVEPRTDTLQIDDALIGQALTPRTRAVMIVHLYGCCAYTQRIGSICHDHRLLLLEDNAQAHGCLFQGRRTGSLGHAAAHSFYPTKNLGALGDAGCVTTDDAELASMVRALGNYGSARKYVFDHVGRNSRLDELQAAVLDAKLPHLDQANSRRAEIAAIYLSHINAASVQLPCFPEGAVWHIFPVLSHRRDALRCYLHEHGVETEIHYPLPPHRQRCYSQWAGLSLPVTERIHAQELSLPCHQAMTDDEALRVAALVSSFRP